MQLNPRYGDDDPVLRVELPLGDVATPLLRQRARLGDLLAGLDDDQWAAPTRCDGWTVRDVIAHLVSTNQFWAISITSGLQGTPTTFLGDFDPVATPAQLVDATRDWTPADTLARYARSNDALADAVEAVGRPDDDGWSRPAETPPGHLPIRVLALHALWDAWIHERDIAVPLDLATVDEPDEITLSLVYGTALGPAFLASTGSGRVGALEVTTNDPTFRFVVDAGATAVVHDGPAPDGAVRLHGDAVALVEAVSYRAPLDPWLTPDERWMLDGLATAFDVADAS